MLRSFSKPRVSNDNHYSESLFHILSTGPTTHVGRSPAKTRPVNGRCPSWIGTTTGTVTAASNSSHPTSATAVPPPRSAGSAPTLTRKPVKSIRGAGADPPAAGTNPKRCGSTSRQKVRNHLIRYHYSKLPERLPRSDIFPESHRGEMMTILTRLEQLSQPRLC